MYNWKWNLTDIKQDKDVTVFSTFSCGGGSSMGYKRAGFRVLGNVEIDPRVNELYVNNLHPKYNFLMDLRDFNERDDLPEELFDLDILDGSPPCTTFSTAGPRENSWGKKKKFREGQKEQTLDDLFFIFLDTVEKLKPKIVVAENVTGIIKGNARGYVSEIIKRFHAMGYDVQIFKLNAALMDVPQARERVFFIANNQGYHSLKLSFNGEPINFGAVKTGVGRPITGARTKELMCHAKKTDMDLGDINMRLYGKNSCFNDQIYWDYRVARTLTSSGVFIRGDDKRHLTDEDFRNVSSFPQDYDFRGQSPQYICGMCVPPNMMANIATEIYKQWLRREEHVRKSESEAPGQDR